MKNTIRMEGIRITAKDKEASLILQKGYIKQSVLFKLSIKAAVEKMVLVVDNEKSSLEIIFTQHIRMVLTAADHGKARRKRDKEIVKLMAIIDKVMGDWGLEKTQYEADII